VLDITCYEWKVTSGTPFPCPPTNAMVTNCTTRGEDMVLLQFEKVGELPPNNPDPDTYDPPAEQNLQVTLRVSDTLPPGPGVAFCDATHAPLFSDFPAVLSYKLRCDFTEPQNVNAGTQVSVSASNADGQGNVSVALGPATATDEDDPDLQFEWNCGASAVDPNGGTGKTGSCSYPADVGKNFFPIVTVTNDCQLSASDSVTVTIVE